MTEITKIFIAPHSMAVVAHQLTKNKRMKITKITKKLHFASLPTPAHQQARPYQINYEHPTTIKPVTIIISNTRTHTRIL